MFKMRQNRNFLTTNVYATDGRERARERASSQQAVMYAELVAWHGNDNVSLMFVMCIGHDSHRFNGSLCTRLTSHSDTVKSSSLVGFWALQLVDTSRS